MLLLLVLLPGLLVDSGSGVVVDFGEVGGFGAAVGQSLGAGKPGYGLGSAGDIIVGDPCEVNGLLPVSVDSEVPCHTCPKFEKVLEEKSDRAFGCGVAFGGCPIFPFGVSRRWGNRQVGGGRLRQCKFPECWCVCRNR